MEWVLGRLGRARPRRGRVEETQQFHLQTLGLDIGLIMAARAALLGRK